MMKTPPTSLSINERLYGSSSYISKTGYEKDTQPNKITHVFTARLINEDGKFASQCIEASYIYGQGDTEKSALNSLKEGIAEEFDLDFDKISLNSEYL